ncbi:MAG: flagellar biosynthetic protein FliR [Clostridia bacterium]|nr:flagellar biosynthetic protein FliR [Clostridia bacterium]
MEALFDTFLNNWEFCLLLFLRISGLIFSSPIFGRNNIPTIVKIGFCGSIAAMLVASGPAVIAQMETFDYTGGVFGFVLLCILELLYGFVLGYVQNLFFQLIAFTGGQMIDMQMGFGMVNVFDVQSNLSVPMMGNFFNLLLLMVFFESRSYQFLIRILVLTVTEIPIGTTDITPEIGLVAVQLFVETFVLATIVAMPIVGAGLVGEACFGILMRVVPQMNAFAIGVPVKIILGFLVISSMIPIYVSFAPQLYDRMFAALELMFSTMRSGAA